MTSVRGQWTQTSTEPCMSFHAWYQNTRMSYYFLKGVFDDYESPRLLATFKYYFTAAISRQVTVARIANVRK